MTKLEYMQGIITVMLVEGAAIGAGVRLTPVEELDFTEQGVQRRLDALSEQYNAQPGVALLPHAQQALYTLAELEE